MDQIEGNLNSSKVMAHQNWKMFIFGVECQNWHNYHGKNLLWCKFAPGTLILGSFRQLLQKLHEDWPSRLQFWTFAALEKCEFRSKCQKPVQSYKRRLREHSKVVFQQFQNVQNFAFKEASLRTFPSICQFFSGSSAPQPRPLVAVWILFWRFYLFLLLFMVRNTLRSRPNDTNL